MAQLTDYEQYLLELINRDRANPSAAASSYGIGLNDGITDPNDIISQDAKQPLAFNFLLNDAANFHSQWMIDNNIFSHAGDNQDRANDRMRDAGYPFIGGEIWAENLSKGSSTSTTGTLNLTMSLIEQINEGLFKSSSHRQNTLEEVFKEVGIAVRKGDFNNFDSVLVTENFGKSGSDTFLTGVAFDDSVLDDSFYSVGEGLGGVEVTAVNLSNNQISTTTTMSSGGYNLALEPGTYEVNFKQNNQTIGNDRRVKIVDDNIKLDLDTSNPSQSIGEIGKINNFDHNNRTIQLDNNYINPVVFALPISYRGSNPAIARITDIQSDEFSFYLQEPEYLDGVHGTESLSYLVLESGTWELEDGTILEVGTVNTNATTTSSSWADIDFQNDFVTAPAVMSQVQTKNGGQFVRTRQDKASIDGFELAMEEEEALKNSGHASETIGWLAIETGYGSWDGMNFRAGHTGARIDHTWDKINFAQFFDDSPSLFASVATYHGSDPVGLRYTNLGASSTQIRLEEDRSLDTEIGHSNESVDFLAIAGSGSLSAAPYDPMTAF
ncbi:MAG: CAP domain-containing protein [Cyanobacteria bacterium J06600_6]